MPRTVNTCRDCVHGSIVEGQFGWASTITPVHCAFLGGKVNDTKAVNCLAFVNRDYMKDLIKKENDQ